MFSQVSKPAVQSGASRREMLARVCCALPGMAMQAQVPAAIPDDWDEKNVLVTVRDRKGQVVKDLTVDDFVLIRDNQPQIIRRFTKQCTLPLTLGIVADVEGSGFEFLAEEADASLEFLKRMMRPQIDKAFLMQFDSQAELLQEPTASSLLLKRALDQLKALKPIAAPQKVGHIDRSFPAALYDSLYLASDEVMEKQGGRKAIVLFTAGEDLGSKMQRRDVMKAAMQAETAIYPIRMVGAHRRRNRYLGGSYPSPPTFPMPQPPDWETTLREMAMATGGREFGFSKKQPLTAIFRQIEDDLRNQYSLQYRPYPRDRDGTFHRIYAAIPKRDDVAVCTRRGYYSKI